MKDQKNPYPAIILWITKYTGRLAAAFIIAILLITSVFFIGNALVENDVVEQRNASMAHWTALNIMATSQEMRRREKDFILRKDVAYLEKYYLLSTAAMDMIEKMKGLPIADKYAHLLRDIGDSIHEHNQQFSLSLLTLQNLGMTPDKGLIGEMNSTASAMDKLMPALLFDPQIKIDWLEIQNRVANYLVTGEMINIPPLSQIVDDMKQRLNQKKILPEIQDQAVGLLDRYVLQYNNVQLQQEIYKDETAKLTTIFQGYEIAVNTLLDMTAVESRAESENISNTIYYSTIFLSLLALLSVLILSLMAILVLRKISKLRRETSA